MSAHAVVMNSHGLSPQAQQRIAAMDAGHGGDLPPPAYDDLAAYATYRVAQHAAWGETTEPGEVEHESLDIAGRPALAAGPEDAPIVLYLHSGGFCLGSPATEIPITARLANHLRVVSLDYRLAPECPYPAGLDDAEAAYRYLAKRHDRVAVAGCSAGGNLAVGVARRCRDIPPAALALLCPHLDIAAVRDRDLRGFEAAYLGSASLDRRHPEISPAAAGAADLMPLPPMIVQWSADEPMAPDICRFVDTVIESNGAVTALMWQGLWHAWHFHRELPEAWAAVDGVAHWLVGALSADLA